MCRTLSMCLRVAAVLLSMGLPFAVRPVLLGVEETVSAASGCASNEWGPDCHVPASHVNEKLVTFLVQMAGFSYCDAWDVEAGDLDEKQEQEYHALLKPKIQENWKKVCAALSKEPKNKKLCESVKVVPVSPVIGQNLIFYPIRIFGEGFSTIMYVFRGTRSFDARDWNTDISDPCPRAVDPNTFEFVDANGAASGQCLDAGTDSGIRVLASMAKSYREQLREHVRNDLKQYLGPTLASPTQIIMMGHSLGGGLAQLATVDLAQSGFLDEYQGMVWLTAVPVNPPRVLGKNTIQSTWEKLMDIQSKTGSNGHQPFFKSIGLGLDWKGFVLWDMNDPITTFPTSRLMKFLQGEEARSTLTQINLIARESALPPMTCPGTSDELIAITAQTKKQLVPRTYDPETGELEQAAVGAWHLPSKASFEATWSQFWYLPQPLRQENQTDWLVPGEMAAHIQSAGVKLRDYVMSAIAKNSTVASALDLIGGKCPFPRPRCGCPFRRHPDPIILQLRANSKWCRLEGSGKGGKLFKIICNAKQDKAQYFAIQGTCMDKSSFAKITLAAVDTATQSLLPCTPNIEKKGLYCSSEVGASLEMELVSLGLAQEMTLRLSSHARFISRKYCRDPFVGKVVCDGTDAKQAQPFRAKVYPNLVEGDWLKQKLAEVEGGVSQDVVEHWQAIMSK